MAPGEASPVSVGREVESQRLGALALQAVAGHGRAVLIDGEPGIGKTTLVDAVEAQCARLGMRVLRGAAEDLEQRLPFAAIGTCLGLRTAANEPGLTRVAGLLRGEGALGQSAAAANREFAVTEAILDLVDQWCAEGSVALILDDVQWADPSSIVVLHRLGQGIDQQPLFLVIVNNSMARDDAVLGLVRSLVSRGAQVLTLSALSEPEVASLVEGLLGAPPGPGLRRLVATAGGNPMYVAELVSALSREGSIEETGGVREVTNPPASTGGSWVPKSLVEVIVQRLDYLPRKARDILEMAAVLGKSIEVAELSAVLDLSVLEISDVVGQGMAAGLLIESGRQLLFRHDLIREALAAHLPAQVRIALQLRAGQVLADTGAPVERVAEHLLAGTEMDRNTVDWRAPCGCTWSARSCGRAAWPRPSRPPGPRWPTRPIRRGRAPSTG
jgi:predicted ATPase